MPCGSAMARIQVRGVTLLEAAQKLQQMHTPINMIALASSRMLSFVISVRTELA